MDSPRASHLLQTTSLSIPSSSETSFRYGVSTMFQESSQSPCSSLLSSSIPNLSKARVSRSLTSTSFQTPPSSPSTSPPTGWDVFISFRGVDTRNKFTDHLYEALDRHNIRTFKDDPGLRTGKVISDTLIQAIHESKTYIVVFSENYASSHWCLDELVEIYNCNRKMQKSIFVVYYNIDPSVVRYQTKSYRKAFQKHETRSKTRRRASKTSNFSATLEKVKKWRLTLAEVAGISGKHIYAERSEAAVINEIIVELLLQINPKALSVATYPVGLDSRVEDITALLSNHTEGVIKIGIYGMGGVGKTTLAKALYNQLLRQRSFNGSCFLANIREVSGTINGLVSLQRQLINDVLKSRNIVEVHNVDQGTKLIEARICSTKVLVVIDDLDNHKQFSSLVRPFASGSVVIITTRDEEMLATIDVEPRYRYMVNELDDAESSALFNQHAFGNSKPSNTLMVLSEDILHLAGGLPLALEVFGSYLYKRSEKGWESFIEKLQRSPDSNIQQRLKISLDALESDDPMLKKLFLDIACFFVGRQKDEVVKIMETYYSHADHKIDILRKRCLLTINNEDALRMHDLLQDMGKEIARNTFPDEPGKYSRLWASNDICDVLKKHKGTEAIEGIIPGNFDYRVSLEGTSFATEAFKRMSKLRFLYLDQVKLTGSFEQALENLRWLCWDRCPLKCLPFEFYPQKLVTLELPRSKMRTMWELNMVDTVPQVFENLKNLNMSDSLNLTTTPDFAKSPCLETITLKGCKSLEEIHVSIGSLISLVSLNLNGCVNLKSLQDSICNLRLLRSLNIGGCSCIEALPSKLGNMKSLKELNAEGLTVSRLPDSIGHLSNLVDLRLSFNRNLQTLPNTTCNLKALEILHIVDCSSLKALPKELGNIESLKELNAQGLNVLMLPESIGRLNKLVKMTLSFNRSLKTLPNTICDLRALESLNIGGCSSLEALPIELGNIKSLQVLHAEGLTFRKLPDSMGCLTNLVELKLSYNNNLESLPDTICDLSSLEILDMSSCKKLELFPRQLWKLTTLRELYARGATLFKKLFDTESSGQIALSLQKLDLSGSSITALPSGISHLSNLEYLDLIDCGHMLSITELPSSLKWIRAAGCTSMESLPNLSNLKKLERLDITDCSSLTEIQGLEELTSINILGLGGCNSSLLAYTFTKRIFQTYSEFGHHIRIYTRVAEFPDWTIQSSNLGSTMSLDFPPNVSHDYLAMILCFILRGNNDFNISNYSVKNTTSDFIWNYSFLSHCHESLIVILPRSIFSVRDGDQRIEITSNSEICGSHLLYRADITVIDEYNGATSIAEDNRSYPSKRSKHLEE